MRQFLSSIKKEASDFKSKDEEDAEEREKGKDGKDDKSAKKDKENKLELDNGIKSLLEGTSNWQAWFVVDKGYDTYPANVKHDRIKKLHEFCKEAGRNKYF